VDSSSYLTIEAFASSIAQKLLLSVQSEWRCITVRAAKPNALPLADSAEVEITRVLSDYLPHEASMYSPLKPSSFRFPGLGFSGDSARTPHKVAIALGSNLGDRFANIELALRLLETPQVFLDGEDIGEFAELAVVDTSFLYETAPMYVTRQPEFVNCACMV
jgi:dihydroneopterin aldolase / 2-amino-4-hydroxy-6-hydroxymethyldihydropteridine diphosphokinase / dihydropteroate synthase